MWVMSMKVITKRGKLLWGCILILLWAGAAYLFFRSNGSLTVEELLRFQPKNKVLAAVAMCGLFLLKSVDFILHSGMLYAINGIMYPLPTAIALNIVGICIMSFIPYQLGKAFGPSILGKLCEKHPKLKETEDVLRVNDFLLAVLLRCIGLPVNVVSLYMGTRRFRMKTYLLGSLIGLLPIMLPYTVMGMSAAEPGSPIFIASIIVELGVTVVALWIFKTLRNKGTIRKTDMTICQDDLRAVCDGCRPDFTVTGVREAEVHACPETIGSIDRICYYEEQGGKENPPNIQQKQEALL